MTKKERINITKKYLPFILVRQNIMLCLSLYIFGPLNSTHEKVILGSIWFLNIYRSDKIITVLMTGHHQIDKNVFVY